MFAARPRRENGAQRSTGGVHACSNSCNPACQQAAGFIKFLALLAARDRRAESRLIAGGTWLTVFPRGRVIKRSPGCHTAAMLARPRSMSATVSGD